VFIQRFECNPIRHSIIEPTCCDDLVFDPVVDHAGADTELLGYLLNGKFLRLLERCRRDLIAPTDPLNNFRGIRPTLGAAMTFSIELSSDLRIGQALSQLVDSLYYGGRVAHAVGNMGGSCTERSVQAPPCQRM